MTQQYYSVGDLATMLGLSRKSVYALLSSGELASNRIGGAVRVSKRDLEAYLDKTRIPARGERVKSKKELVR